jgi:hypothetical protein
MPRPLQHFRWDYGGVMHDFDAFYSALLSAGVVRLAYCGVLKLG